MKVALLCDVDQTVYHVGDEAIATMSARRLEARGVEVVRISRHEKYGPEGARPRVSIPALTFPWPLEQRAAYLREIREVLAGRTEALPAHDKLFEIIEQLRTVDALVIGGGGSLTSRFGWLLDERLATALVARFLGKPVVLSGQSLGPELTDSDREGMRELLAACTLVGLRDERSVRLARRLRPDHPAIVHTLDDAVGLGLEQATAGPDPDLIAVTLGGDGDPFPREDYLAVAAAVVDELARRTGARVELVPHMADPDTGGGDEQAHAELAARLATPVSVHRVETDGAAALRTTGAGWVISTRFHPVVFGTAAGSSVLALPLNRYGAARMDGALRNVGLAGATVPLAALWDPATGAQSDLVGPVIEALIQRRESERTHLDAARPRLLEAADTWWDTVVQTLRTARTGHDAPGVAVTDPAGAGLEPAQRWDEGLRERLAPWTTTVASTPQPPAAALIMRTRDRPRMLERAVQDVLAQTRQDWELVIVNDAGDRAGVEEIVARHDEEADGRVRVLHREHSRGMEAASNAGLRATSAPAVVVHDDDDTWHATFLQETLAHLDAHPEHDAVVVRTLLVLEHETDTGFVEDEVFPSWPQLQGARLLDYIAVNRSVPISMLHRRSVHEQLGEYDESLPVVGDYAFHLALLQRGAVGWIERPLAQWRQRPTATGASGNSMHTHSDGHRHYDAELRERYFQQWTRQNGIGLPLFLSKNTETHVARSEERLLQELGTLRADLRATREELAEVRGRLARMDPVALGGRVVRRAKQAGRRAATEGRRVLRRRD